MRRSGFTLIELMLALTISTVILGAAGVALVTMIDSHERGSRAASIMKEARSIADLLERHLRSAMPPDSADYVVFEGEDLSDDETDGHRLTLLSAAPGRFPRSAPLRDASEVTFELDPQEADGLTMRIDATPDDLPDRGGYLMSLGDSVRSLSVTYYDGKDWIPDWTRQYLPMAVQFTITLEPRAESQSGGSDRTASEKADDTSPYYSLTRLVWLPLGQDGTPVRSTGQTTGQAVAATEATPTGGSTETGQTTSSPSGSGSGSRSRGGRR